MYAKRECFLQLRPTFNLQVVEGEFHKGIGTAKTYLRFETFINLWIQIIVDLIVINRSDYSSVINSMSLKEILTFVWFLLGSGGYAEHFMCVFINSPCPHTNILLRLNFKYLNIGFG